MAVDLTILDLKRSINFPEAKLYAVKTTIPNDESGDDLLGELIIRELGKPLPSTRAISNYFGSKTPLEYLHFIVGL